MVAFILVKLSTSTVKPTRPLILMLLLFVLLILLFALLNFGVPKVFPTPQAQPLSPGALVESFYSIQSNETKQTKRYELVIENQTISTQKLVIDTSYDVYFINKQSVEYLLEILSVEATSSLPYRSVSISPNQVYSVRFDQTGRYTFALSEKGSHKFDGEIYVQ